VALFVLNQRNIGIYMSSKILIEINPETMQGTAKIPLSKMPGFAKQAYELIDIEFSPEDAMELADYLIQKKIAESGSDTSADNMG